MMAVDPELEAELQRGMELTLNEDLDVELAKTDQVSA